jgi:glycosyltransferase involved in cell wall biosynthesis
MTFTSPRIGMVLEQAFPPDARVEREALALLAAGFEVHLLCEVPKQGGYYHLEDHKGIIVHRVDPSWASENILGTPFKSEFMYRGVIKNVFREVFNWDTRWKKLIDLFVEENSLQALHIHDLRLVDTGLAVAKKHRIPLVADLHENFPALMEMFKGKENPRRGKRQRKRWDRIQKSGAQKAKAVITVSDEMKDILKKQGISEQKIWVLPNTVDIEKFQSFVKDPVVSRQTRERFVLSYIGHLNNTHRGIQTVLEALPLLAKQIPNLLFIGAGGIREPYMELLQGIIDKHNLHEFVQFTGWLDESDFRTYIESADICLCPHIANDQTNTGIPNKVYLYHLWGKPIVASDFTPMKRYMDETQGGLSYASGNAEALASAILELYNNVTLRHQLGKNGKAAVLSKYNWSQTEKSLITLYQSIFPNAVLSSAEQNTSLALHADVASDSRTVSV